MTESEPVVELLPCKTMYRVTLQQDGFELSSCVSSLDLVDEEVKYFRDKINEMCREAYLKGHDDI
jgi:hypothetical protein